MSEPTNTAVECPICGEGFDPTAAGGWCTNPECGEWQYLGEEVPEPDESSADQEPGPGAESETAESPMDGTATPDADPAAEDDESMADAAAVADAIADVEPETTGASVDDESSAEATSGDGTDTGATVDDETDAESTADAGAADESEAEPIEFTAEPGETAEEAAGDAVVEDTDEEVDLEFDAAEEGEAATDEPAGEEPADQTPPGEADLIFESAVDLEESDGSTIDAVCPDCGASIDVSDNFCPDCGADLHESPVEDCPECGTEVAPDDAFCGACGADLEGESAPARLALRARGEEVLVDADQTVGREIRRLVTDTGGGEDEAVRIHREHVRFVREDGRFYVVDLGDNPTEVNGRRLSKGDREPIGPGDEIDLSGVVTLSVAEP